MDTLDKMEKIPSAGDTYGLRCPSHMSVRSSFSSDLYSHAMLCRAGVRGDRPVQEIRLNKVTIHANPLAG